MAGIEALQDCNIKIPDDVSVIGIDNAPYSAASPVALSSIDQKHRQQGIMLAKMLLDRINYPDMPLTSLSIIESDFIERRSLARAR
jgi:DNA-binding LacI/PurR family transcriptional regulator